MEWKYLLYEEREGIGIITINRPDKLNALNKELLGELRGLIEGVKSNGQIKVVILTGSGEKAFAAGADIGEIAELGLTNAFAFSRDLQQVTNEIEGLGKPVIGGINGLALGGGFELVLACHLRIFSENAKMGLPEVGLGAIPGMGGTQRLPRIIGKTRALWTILTGEMIDALEAERIGLINKVAPHEKLPEATRQLAQKILQNGPAAMALQKKLIAQWMDLNLTDSIEAGIRAFRASFQTDEPGEGMKAFLEKRRPSYAVKLP